MSTFLSSGATQALKVSQNYLTSTHIIQKILNLTNLTSSDHVVEIGPGKGHITRALLQRCARVSAVELDHGLFSMLQEKFIGAQSLELHHQDFLTWEMPETGNYKVFSNIPFNRTTAIVRKLTECPNPPQEAWLVMEKGAAKRFIGKPCESLRSLLLKPYFDLEIVHHFKRDDFHPMPSVDVVLLRMVQKAQPDVATGQSLSYTGFITCGMQRGMRGLSCYLGRSQLTAAFRQAGIHPGANPGDILYIQWLCLYRCFCKLKNTKLCT